MYIACETFDASVFAPFVLGDCNGDGEIDVRELVNIKNIASANEFASYVDINKDGKVNSADTVNVMQYLLGVIDENWQAKKKIAETPLSNTYKLLTNDKKLTIGYIGGSITLGISAAKVIENGNVVSTDGSYSNSWVNRTSAWFASEYPNAEIETVNAGVSETQTSLALYRLEDHLMNTNGHDMPDLVFVEFTTNDSKDYAKEEHITHIESLFNNIWKHNPYAEIVVVSTNRYQGQSYSAYKQVCNRYNIPFIDVGTKLANLITERSGVNAETAGGYYYTVDDIHPSALGYAEYFEEIKLTLEKELNFTIKNNDLYNYANADITQLSGNLISSPGMITVDNMTYSDNATVVDEKIEFAMFGTATDAYSRVCMADNYLSLAKGSTVSANFNGSTLGMFLRIDKGEYSFRYKIDNGDWKDYVITRKQAEYNVDYMLEYDLSDTEHTVEVEFLSDVNPGLIAFLAKKK